MGKQHCIVIVIFSGLTGKPLAMKHDQLSCIHCNHVTMKLILGGKKGKDITVEDLLHPGKQCYINTKYSPAVADEHAMEELGKNLLINLISGKCFPNDKVILALQCITDRDTKQGSKATNR